MLYVAYSRVVRETGGIPVVPVPTDTPEISALVDRLDSPITTGGGDMGPAPHGSDTHKSVFAVDPEPDAFETALAGEFAAGRLPTPAICPGLQVINVALGGTLIVNITAIWTGLDEGTPPGKNGTGSIGPLPSGTWSPSPGRFVRGRWRA